ncbi:peptidase [Anoxynatronum buryatiense]|uniref:Gram-positive cocci surface proteins LPxTG domain-containing protein n=1 Tax=Anoxynatronum buryatiense TaxID=489973 RepID=A0AA45WZ25_9CLOT|nr:peptidase [Anoxynatronum buryatiense]SMP71696.1 hypothetical protein SAMN06296020_12422 [Anoxynatronum buryatiense]
MKLFPFLVALLLVVGSLLSPVAWAHDAPPATLSESTISSHDVLDALEENTEIEEVEEVEEVSETPQNSGDAENPEATLDPENPENHLEPGSPEEHLDADDAEAGLDPDDAENSPDPENPEADLDPDASENSLDPDDQLPEEANPAGEMIDPSALAGTLMADPIKLVAFDEPYPADAVAFALGTSQETLTDWFAGIADGFFGYDEAGNDYYLPSGTWSVSAINTSVAGVYTAWAEPDLESTYVLAEGVALPRQLSYVSIQATGAPDLNCFVAARGFLRFPWVLSPEQQQPHQLDQFVPWLRQDQEEWTSLTEGFWVTEDYFQLSQHLLDQGSTYTLQVDYPGGQTGILSFLYDETLMIIDYSGGDRDGGDVGGSGPGTGSQPGPTPPPVSGDGSSTDGGENAGHGDDNTPPDDSAAAPTTPDADSATPSPVPPAPPSEDPGTATEKKPAAPPLTNGNAAAQTTSMPSTAGFLAFSRSMLSFDILELLHKGSTASSAAVHAAAPTEPASAAEKGFFENVGASPADNTETQAFISGDLPEITSRQASDETSEQISAVLSPSASPPLTPRDDQPSTALAGQLPEPVPSPASAPVMESYSPTQTVISGLRLRDLLEDEETVVFGTRVLTVSIPSEVLQAFDLAFTDTLSVTLTQPAPHQIFIGIEAGGAAVTAIPETVVRLEYPLPSPYAVPTIQHEAGFPVSQVAHDGEFLSFPIDTAGTYLLSSPHLSADTGTTPAKNLPPLVPLSGGLLLSGSGLGLTYFMRRRHG